MFDHRPRPLAAFFPFDRDGNPIRVFVVFDPRTNRAERFVERTRTHATAFFVTPSAAALERFRVLPASFLGADYFARTFLHR
jgi:hypothetical protein